MWFCICLSGDRKRAVKISTRQAKMSWLLKGMGDGTLIGLLHDTPKTHLWVLDQPFLDLRRAQESLIRRYNSNSSHKATCVSRFSLAFQTVKIGPLLCVHTKRHICRLVAVSPEFGCKTRVAIGICASFITLRRLFKISSGIPVF